MKKAWLFVFCCLFCFVQNAEAIAYEETENISLERILEKKRAVFRIFSVINHKFCSGTGFLVSDDGLIVTNSHVVHNASDITVYILSEDGSFAHENSAKIAQDDPKKDLALIRLQSIPDNLPTPLDINGKPASVLDEVVAMGFPAALDRPVSVAADLSGNVITDPTFIENLDPNVTKGAVSKVGSWIIHDAKISSGNSGGPLVSLKTGKVLGVNTAKTQGTTSFYMAIPVRDVKFMTDHVQFTNDYTEIKEKLAEKGDVEAMVSLACLLYDGLEEDKRDPQRALLLMKKAADLGNKEAMCELGYMYSDDLSIKPNAELAIKYLTESGLDRAKLRLCEIYMDGIPSCNFKATPAKGFLFVKEFAESSRNPLARKYLATCYRTGTGTKRNIAEAVKILHELIEEDDKLRGGLLPIYQLDLGKTLLEGNNRNDIDEGISILKSLTLNALDSIKGSACHILGNSYFYGQKLKKDERLGAYYYQLGMDVNNIPCTILFANACLYGKGIEKNEKLGFSLIRKAVDQGASEKVYGLIGAYLIDNKKEVEAVPFLQKAAIAGCGISACRMAFLYYYGESGVKRNRTAAIQLLNHVVKNSDNPKEQKLARELLQIFGKKSRASTSKSMRYSGYAPRVQPKQNEHRW